MSKIVYVCYKNPELRDTILSDILRISDRISPDNITPAPTKILEQDGIIYGIINPVDVTKEENGSVLLGGAFGDTTNWSKPKASLPDGSYAIFRADSDYVEVATDAAGSRSVWYYQDDDLFIAATSQRAIVAIIGNFQFNKNVLPWILSTGSLGPSNSWDSRIKLLTPDSSIILNRTNWTLEILSNKIEFKPQNSPDADQENLLQAALLDTFSGLNLDFDKWALPLSGGYDSRGILCLLDKIGAKLSKLRAITWGLNSSVNEKGNDAYVAKKLASFFNMPHKYYSTDLANEPIETVLNRFITCGEGRIDHIGGYLDGFKIWKTLYEENVQGVIRGDVSFSEKPAISIDVIRAMQGMSLCSDYSNLQNYETLGLPKQEVPTHLTQQTGESITAFRDRLYHQFRIPTILAALNDLKLSYVEILNPLLSRRVLYQTRQLPDHLRSGKTLFKKVVNTYSPKIEYASSNATASMTNVLKSAEVVNLFKSEFSLASNQHAISKELLEFASSNLKTKSGEDLQKRSSFKALIKRLAPAWLKNKRHYIAKSSSLDPNIIGFRIYTICKMHQLLLEDANRNQLEREFSLSASRNVN